MKAEIITVGTELLLGQIVDTNSTYLSKKLAEIGIDLFFKTTVGDNKERLKQALLIAENRADVIILTGGLGPTVDDITREAISEFTGKNLIFKNDILLRIDEYFKNRNIIMPECNKIQAYIPDGAIIIENKVGTAPGFIIEHNSKIIIAMPGVPSEMIPMMENTVIPYLIQKEGYLRSVIKSKVIKVTGLPESEVNDKIKDLFENLTNPTIGVLAHQTEIEVRITAKAENEKIADELIKDVKKKIYERLNENIFAEDNETLEEKVAEILFEKKLTVAVAESCTSGLLAFRLTKISGSSSYFMGGVNVYSNFAKYEILNVNKETLEKYGAVSEKCAGELAINVRKKFKTDIGISITGIAGPSGGTKEKPVGLVFSCIDIKDKINLYKYNFAGAREVVRARAAQMVLFNLYKLLKGSI